MTFDRSGITDRQRQFLELTLAAMQELDRMKARPAFSPLFRIWDYDPHRTYRSWLIQIPEDDDSPHADSLVLERTWDATADREGLARNLRRRPHLHPTMVVREAVLPKEEFAFLRSAGKRTPYSRLELRDAHTSLQSAQYGIEGFRKDTVSFQPDRIRLEWGGNPPPELKAVAAWAARMRSVCSGCFGDEDISILRAGVTGSCSLCRTPALSEVQACPECRSPYHRECWEYVGRCAIYGCPGSRA